MTTIAILITVGYILGFYFYTQGLRSPLDRPAIYDSEVILFILNLIFGWIPTIYGLYLTFIEYSWLGLVILILIRFIIIPTFFNKLLLKIMNK